MHISPQTRLLAVLGHPVRHSLSPAMQNAALAARNLDALYLAFDVPPQRLAPTLALLADLGFMGVNLTVPLKEIAFQNIQSLDESAQRLGSVNTVKFTPQGPQGFSTDGEGFLRAIGELWDLQLRARALFILGCGGAGRAVAIAAALAGANLSLADRDQARAEKLRQELTALGIQAQSVDAAAWPAASRQAELVINATPQGLQAGEASPLPPSAFRAGQWVYDLIYTLPETPLMRIANQQGAITANGLGMLLHQGALAFQIWTGQEPPLAVMRRALEQGLRP